MSKQIIKPGQPMEILTPEELVSHLENQSNGLLNALGKNARFRRIYVGGNADAGGNITLEFTPNDGFLWDIKAACIAGGATVAGKTAGVYLGETNPINQILVVTTGNPWSTMPNKTAVVRSTEYVYIKSTVAFTANDPIVGMLAVVEVPFSHEAQLLL